MNGEVIAFISAPGVGTSFLTRQMACRNMLPGFFEGEEGIFTPSVLNVLNSEEDTRERYIWLAERTRLMLERAHTIARAGIDSYVDGDVLLMEAWLAAEVGSESPAFLKEWLLKNARLMAHKVVILTASDEKIQENIIRRGRASEQTKFIKERALRIGRACIGLAEKYDHVKVLDRSNLEFTDSKTLAMIDELIQTIPSHK
ncbi:MAG: hypothetical protein UX10_C0031G0014 [Candidatus Magasanikbacteria bacterium GW2011_GWA2_45_39]|uniref:AAA family ATPase n=1 Tax=Candidatus Magasanikbacteria bacterium GW2011_GWA2_45_39 TaxID=1619041 RepID=A0A0G1PM60_9BACT|nr:MAG: hypothetical protein UX10_C0031G0014 [Candidatus Magasanikbacteria bacterium GW2011_GWA2_45_39]